MKKLWILIAAFAVISCKNEAAIDYVVLSGKVKNKLGRVISITDKSDLTKKVIEVSADGYFVDTLIIKNNIYNFFDGKNEFTFYLEPGNVINVDYDATDFLNSLTFSGVGSEISTYQLDKIKTQNEIVGVEMDVYKLDEDDFITKITNLKTALSKLINASEGISEEYKAKELRNIHYGYLSKLRNYERYHAHYANLADFKTSDGFLNELEELDYNNEDDFLFSSDYKKLVISYYYDKGELMAVQDSIEKALAFLKSVATIENEAIKNELLIVTANHGITITNDIEGYYKTYLAAFTGEENNNFITEKYNKLVSISKGKPSPKFIDYENNAGGTTSLDDLKGKFVYVNIWVTGNPACASEIPFLKEVEKKYQGKNISFVSISVDKATDHDKWKKMILEEKLEGIQLFADKSFYSDFVMGYLINFVPRYILIDPDGNIVNSNAPKPSDKSLINLFNEQNI